MTSPENGPARRGDLPTEAIPAMVPPSSRAARAERIELPEIVPATTESGEPAEPQGPPTEAVVRVIDEGPSVPEQQVQSARVLPRRPRVRRVTRVVRHLDPWSVFKVAAMFNLAAYVVTLTSGVMLWRVADSTGTLDNVERWFTQFGWETFELDGGEVYHNAWTLGLFAVVALTGLAVLLATLFNLISDLVGGVVVSVLEEEVVAVDAPASRFRRARRNG